MTGWTAVEVCCNCGGVRGETCLDDDENTFMLWELLDDRLQLRGYVEQSDPSGPYAATTPRYRAAFNSLLEAQAAVVLRAEHDVPA